MVPCAVSHLTQEFLKINLLSELLTVNFFVSMIPDNCSTRSGGGAIIPDNKSIPASIALNQGCNSAHQLPGKRYSERTHTCIYSLSAFVIWETAVEVDGDVMTKTVICNIYIVRVFLHNVF